MLEFHPIERSCSVRIGSWTKRPDEKQGRRRGAWSSIAAFNTRGHIRSALDVAWTMTPVDRQNRGRERFLRVTSGHAAAYTNFEWVESGFGRPPLRPIEMEFDRALSAPLPFVPFPPSTPRLSPFIHLPIRRTAAAAIKRQRQVPEWRSAADAQCAPLLSSPRVQSKRAHPEPLTKRVLPRFIYLPFESSRFFSSTMYPTMCPRWNFFVVGSSLGWREGCNWRSLFVSYSRKDKTSKNICASVSLNEKGAIIPRISLQANLFPLDFAYTRHSCVVTPFSSSTIKNFEFFSRLKRTFSLSQNNDIWLDVATFLASLTTRRNPMKSLSIQS